MNKRGQSIIEYSLIAVLVILGIIYMGPYVLRSINAHFKLWDDSVHDSFSENITQAPVNDVPFINVTCTCGDEDEGCGTQSVLSPCPANQRAYKHQCTPNFCDSAPGAYCTDDPKCCLAYHKQGCGNIPLPKTPAAHTTVAPTADNNLPGTCYKYDPAVYPATANNCYYGQYIYETGCTSPSIVCCREDIVPNGAGACDAQCLRVTSPGIKTCSTTVPPAITLDQTYGLTFVAQENQGACGSTAGCTYCGQTSVPCQVYCDSSQGYWLNPSGTGCTNDFNVAPRIDGYYYPDTCVDVPPNCKCKNSGGEPSTTVNTCSFNMCVQPSTAIITSTTMTDVSDPEIYPYCGSPHGHPGELCQLTFTY